MQLPTRTSLAPHATKGLKVAALLAKGAACVVVSAIVVMSATEHIHWFDAAGRVITQDVPGVDPIVSDQETELEPVPNAGVLTLPHPDETVGAVADIAKTDPT